MRYVLIIILIVVGFAASVLLPVDETLQLMPRSIRADGNSSAHFYWAKKNVYNRPIPYYPIDVQLEIKQGADKVKIIGNSERTSGPASLELGIKAKWISGDVELLLSDGDRETKRRLSLVAAADDHDRDGFPDAVELVDEFDRQAFVRWFVAIAEAQFFNADRRWAKVHRDCAGLARYAYKEALKIHDAKWFEDVAYLHQAANPDVRRYNYPQVPLLKDRLFRKSPGAFKLQSVDIDFSASASARVLKEFNTFFVSKKLESAEAGDVLFFEDPERLSSSMHTMILLDAKEKRMDRRVVYHTGQNQEDDLGEVRLVTIADLNIHTDGRWHVTPNNPHFLGFFRWKILKGGRP
jgi:uncharacterized protein YfaT (DUF1175 family)